jgi:hypothetical protein
MLVLNLGTPRSSAHAARRRVLEVLGSTTDRRLSFTEVVELAYPDKVEDDKLRALIGKVLRELHSCRLCQPDPDGSRSFPHRPKTWQLNDYGIYASRHLSQAIVVAKQRSARRQPATVNAVDWEEGGVHAVKLEIAEAATIMTTERAKHLLNRLIEAIAAAEGANALAVERQLAREKAARKARDRRIKASAKQ